MNKRSRKIIQRKKAAQQGLLTFKEASIRIVLLSVFSLLFACQAGGNLVSNIEDGTDKNVFGYTIIAFILGGSAVIEAGKPCKD